MGHPLQQSLPCPSLAPGVLHAYCFSTANHTVLACCGMPLWFQVTSSGLGNPKLSLVVIDHGAESLIL